MRSHNLLALLLLPLSAAALISLPSLPLPSNASQLLDPYLISFSFETAYIQDFLGNTSHPNELVLNLLGEIENRTGGIAVRPGGITADSSIYDPSLSSVETLTLSSSGGIYRTTYGPAFFDSLKLLPQTTEFVLCLNFGNDTLEIAADQATAGVQELGGRLVALEIGNEPDQYTSAQRNLSSWSGSTYTSEWLAWSTNISSFLSLPEPFFQAGAMAMDPTPSALFTTSDLVQEKIDQGGSVRWFSQHMYQYSTCDPERNVLIGNVTTLVEHQNITNYIDLWRPQVTAAQSVGAQLVIGEFSSVSCSGKENVTNTFGQALWLADTYLYSAFINITRLYSHQGGTLALQSSSQSNTLGFSWYDFVYPAASDRNGPASATPSFVGFLLIAEALGPSANASQIVYFPQADNEQVAVYGVYDSTNRTVAEGPARIIILNLSNDPAEMDLLALKPRTVKRLSSSSVQSTNASEAMFAGQSYALGSPSGEEVVEGVGANGTVHVGPYEGVLVFLGEAKVGAGGGSTSSSAAGAGQTGGSSGGQSAGERGREVRKSWTIAGLVMTGALFLFA